MANKTRIALQYLMGALEIEQTDQKQSQQADTHLNLCAVLSQMDRHEDALKHALLGISLLQEEFLNASMQYYKAYRS